MAGIQHWTEEMYQLVRDMWPTGKSSRLIAEAVNKISAVKVSRNAVISRANFLGLRTPNQKVNQFAFKPSQPKPPKPVVSAKTIGKLATEVERTVYDAAPLLDPDGQPYTLENCDNRMCRFVAGEVSAFSAICGHPRKRDKPYCEQHSLRCYVAPTPYYKKPEPMYR